MLRASLRTMRKPRYQPNVTWRSPVSLARPLAKKITPTKMRRTASPRPCAARLTSGSGEDLDIDAVADGFPDVMQLLPPIGSEVWKRTPRPPTECHRDHGAPKDLG